MFTTILVATDGSKLSAKAVALAIRAAKCFGAELTVCFATTRYTVGAYGESVLYDADSEGKYDKLCRQEGARILDAVARKTAAAGVKTNITQAVASAPWQAILATAKKSKCDVIVMASHGRRGISALLLGSETQKVLTHSKLPVIVVR
jgi:Universal stress protein UspA and related nucleotide-binding proteins